MPFAIIQSMNASLANPGRLAASCAVMSLIVAVAACGTTPSASGPSATAIKELAPSGKLRAAINFGNPILASKDGVTGEPRGVSVDLSRELAKRLGTPVELVMYSAAGKVVEGARANEWDIAFVAIDPKRAADMDYTAPYVIIEGAYMVPVNSAIRINADVDRPGVRVVVGAGSAYDLYLSREIRSAELVRAPTSPLVADTMVKQSMEVAAGVKQQLEADAKRIPGVRLLDGSFMVINQAMATPKERPEGTRYLKEFIEEMKASGFVAKALQRHRIEGAAIAPLAGQ
jgi:polar amino acid transport system substrate-binding protein